MTMTLDDVAKRIDSICNEYVAAVTRAQDDLQTAISGLAEEVESATDLDKNAAKSIVFGRVRRMISDVDKAMTQ